MEREVGKMQGEVSTSKVLASIAGVIATAALVVCIGYHFFFSDKGPGLFLPKYVRIENYCKQISAKETAKIQAEASKIKIERKEGDDLKNLGADLAEGMTGFAVGMVSGMSEAFCMIDAEECKKFPDECDSAIERLKKKL